MLTSYLRTALRNLRRNRGFAFLNVAGLSLGLACVILIALYAHDELIVDDFHERADRIARVDLTWTEDGEVDELPVTPGIMGPEIAARVPSAKAVVRVSTTDDVLTVGDEAMQADRGRADGGRGLLPGVLVSLGRRRRGNGAGRTGPHRRIAVASE